MAYSAFFMFFYVVATLFASRGLDTVVKWEVVWALCVLARRPVPEPTLSEHARIPQSFARGVTGA